MHVLVTTLWLDERDHRPIRGTKPCPGCRVLLGVQRQYPQRRVQQPIRPPSHQVLAPRCCNARGAELCRPGPLAANLGPTLATFALAASTRAPSRRRHFWRWSRGATMPTPIQATSASATGHDRHVGPAGEDVDRRLDRPAFASVTPRRLRGSRRRGGRFAASSVAPGARRPGARRRVAASLLQLARGRLAPG